MSLQDTPSNSDANLVQFRIERGATAMGTDGALGSVEQIVVDRDTGELRALIVHGSGGTGEFELPASHVTRATGSYVYLDIGQADLARRPDLATPYDPQQYVPVYQGNSHPVGQATRTAMSTEHPVVTGVEENAAELVAHDTTAGLGPDEVATTKLTLPPETRSTDATAVESAPTMPLTDSAAVHPPSASASPASAPTDTRAEAPAAQGQPAVQTGPSIGEGSDVAPGSSLSTTPSTTGALMGGLPSTGGMGGKSTVPNSDSEPNNMRLDEESTPERASSEPGLLEAFREGGSEPWSVPTDELTATESHELASEHADELEASRADDEVAERDGLDAVRPVDMSAPEPAVSAAETTAPAATPAPSSPATPPSGETTASMPTPPPLSGLAGTMSAERQLTESTFGSRLTAQVPQLSQLPQLVSGVPNTALLAASGLGAGIGMGILLRQRQNRARSAARQARAKVMGAQRSAADMAAQTAANAKAAGKQAKRTTKRVASHARWFRRGLLLGGVLAILFAPKPGEELRDQITAALDSWRSRSA